VVRAVKPPSHFFEGSKFRYQFYFPLVSTLPHGLAYRLANLYGAYQAKRHSEAQAHIVHQMRQVLAVEDPAKLAAYAEDFYRLASRDIVDTYKFPKYSTASDLSPVVATKGLENLIKHCKAGKKAILTGAHFGRFWMAGLPIVQQGVAVGTMTRDRMDENRGGLSNTEFAYRKKKLETISRAFKGPFLFTGESIRRYFDAPENLIMAMIFDVPVLGESSRHCAEVEFFGKAARFPSGVARLAKARGAAIFPYFMHERDGRLTAEFLPAIEADKRSPDELIQLLVHELEARIRNAPGHWWLWDALPLFLTES
jgi:lauroyl/myristoyl acyltransferase